MGDFVGEQRGCTGGIAGGGGVFDFREAAFACADKEAAAVSSGDDECEVSGGGEGAGGGEL